jgi:phenylalanyl-tRNA synthetase beta chain
VEYPQKIFEVGDCIHITEKEETKTKSIRKLAGVVSNYETNLTELKSLVESVLKNLGYNYTIKEFNHPSFIESRCGEILIDNKRIGFFGEVHPQVLENWKLENPVIAFEIEVD